MKIVGVDTEFSNDRSYIPILSLLQVYDGSEILLFDAIEEDLRKNEYLVNLLQNENITKVFHASRLDIEAIYHYFKYFPRNIIDTQILAKKMNLGHQISYVTLVKQHFNIELDKKFQYSNWLKRPLKQDQLDYAKLDVLYLIDLYKIFNEKLEEQEMIDAKNEVNSFLKHELYSFDNERFWKKRVNKQYKNHQKKDKIKRVAMWREELAFKLNRPREHVFPWNEFIVQIDKGEIILSARFKNHEAYLNKIIFSD